MIWNQNCKLNECARAVALTALGFSFFAMTAKASEDFVEYYTEVLLVPESLESAELTRVVEPAVPSVVEQDVPFESPEIVKKTSVPMSRVVRNPEKVATARDFDAMQSPQMERIAQSFLRIVSASRVAAEDKKFVVSADALLKEEPALASFDSSKTYSFSHKGILSEVNTENYYMPSRRKIVQGEGWTVSLAENSESSTSTAQTSRVVSRSNTAVTRESGSGFSFANPSSEDSLVGLSSVTRRSAHDGPIFHIDASQTKGILHNAASDALSNQYAAKRVALSGRVIVPKGLDARSVRIRIAGTDVETSPDRDGFFQFLEIPSGSRFELLAWDDLDRMNRRIVPVTASSEGREFEILMDSNRSVQNLAAAFGDIQDVRQAGFCGYVEGKVPYMLKDALVTVKSSTRSYKARYFDAQGLPNQSLLALEVTGRFCVFNVVDEIVDVEVVLANGTRRSFAVHSKPTVFDSALALDMDRTAYRTVSQMELIDFDEAMNAKQRDASFVFGTPGTRDWYDGMKTATWLRVGHAAIGSDRSYSAQVVPIDDSEPIYFPTAQEYAEVRFGKSIDSLNAFTLVSRDRLMLGSASDAHPVFVDKKNPLALKMLDASSIEEMERVSGKNFSKEAGVAFVSVDLAALNLNYADVRFSVRDVWTGQRVGEHAYVLPRQESNPRIVRFFVNDIPLGQHVLVISDSQGAIHWLDVVRSRPSMLQILSVGE